MAKQSVSAEVTTTDFAALAESLENGARRDRQEAAAGFASAAVENPSSIAPYIPLVIDAVGRSEVRTRMYCMDALTHCCLSKDAGLASACADALEPVESALFDDDNGKVQLSAVRFFCAYGSTGADASAAVWPVLDDSLQCFHGNPEFFDMLNAIAAYAASDLAPEVRKGLASRLAFDASNGKGLLQKKAKAIIQAAKGK